MDKWQLNGVTTKVTQWAAELALEAYFMNTTK